MRNIVISILMLGYSRWPISSPSSTGGKYRRIRMVLFWQLTRPESWGYKNREDTNEKAAIAHVMKFNVQRVQRAEPRADTGELQVKVEDSIHSLGLSHFLRSQFTAAVESLALLPSFSPAETLHWSKHRAVTVVPRRTLFNSTYFAFYCSFVCLDSPWLTL